MDIITCIRRSEGHGRKEAQWQQDSDADNITLTSFSSIETMQRSNLSGQGTMNNAKAEIDQVLEAMTELFLSRHLSQATLVQHVRSQICRSDLAQVESIMNVDDYILAKAKEMVPGFARVAVREFLESVDGAVAGHVLRVGSVRLVRDFFPAVDAQVMGDSTILELAQQIVDRTQPPVEEVAETANSAASSSLTASDADAAQSVTVPRPDAPADLENGSLGTFDAGSSMSEGAIIAWPDDDPNAAGIPPMPLADVLVGVFGSLGSDSIPNPLPLHQPDGTVVSPSRSTEQHPTRFQGAASVGSASIEEAGEIGRG